MNNKFHICEKSYRIFKNNKIFDNYPNCSYVFPKFFYNAYPLNSLNKAYINKGGWFDLLSINDVEILIKFWKNNANSLDELDHLCLSDLKENYIKYKNEIMIKDIIE